MLPSLCKVMVLIFHARCAEMWSRGRTFFDEEPTKGFVEAYRYSICYLRQVKDLGS